MEIDSNNLLTGENITKLSCPKNSQPFQQGLPDTIVIHYTADSSGEKSAAYLCRDDVKASAHLVIGRDEKIFQLVPFNIIAWHAGISEYGGRTDLNRYSVGIEIDNAGYLTQNGSSYISTFGKVYPASEVLLATHRNEKTPRYWHTYTEKQIDICRDICILLINKYNIKTIVGHEEIAPARKVDPGPAFPLDKLRNDLLLDVRKTTDTPPSSGIVTAGLLNIRETPSLQGALIANPLTQNTNVEILGEKDGWYRVRTEIEGYVDKNYIQIINK